MRELWLKTHRWLGLGIGLFFFIAALTGAVLVYENELDAWINGGEYRVTAGDVGLERVIEGAVREVTGSPFVVRWPHPRERVYVVEIMDADDRVRPVRIDPGSGDVAQRARPKIPVVRLIRRAHTTLLAGRPGHYVVLIASVLALISMITGLILWWPGVRRFVKAFAVRTKRGFYPLNFDLHQATGAAVLPLLFVITLTGILIPYQQGTTRVVRLIVGGEAEERSGEQQRPATDAIARLEPWDLVDAARQASSGEPVMLRMPRRAGNPAVVELLRGARGRAGGIVAVSLDPSDGRVLSVRDPQRLPRASRIAGALNFNLHIGAVGGPFVRIIYVAVCLVGAGLAVSGFLIWWLKRARIEAVARRRSAAS